jgi:hypothetical protein
MPPGDVLRLREAVTVGLQPVDRLNQADTDDTAGPGDEDPHRTTA